MTGALPEFQATSAPASELLLPEGRILLHIGPHKTGTTALQAMLAGARPQLVRHGVSYPGHERAHHMAALAISGAKGLVGEPPAKQEHWQRLLADIRLVDARRTVVSSEFFCDQTDEQARRVVADLGADRVHVLVTLRPLASILPSAWQQYVRNRLRVSYSDWLQNTLRGPAGKQLTPSFWRRHRHDVLVERWARVVGPENVTVLVLDPVDRDLLPRSVEEMLGVPHGLLDRTPDRSNRSLTVAEVELVRRLNMEFVERGWPDVFYRAFVRQGLVLHLTNTRTPPPEEPQIGTPAWAFDHVAAVGAQAAESIRASGVRVVGDLALLGAAPRPGTSSTVVPVGGERAGDETVRRAVLEGAVMPTDVAVNAVVGLIGVAIGSEDRERVPLLGAFTAKQLSAAVARRVAVRARAAAGLSGVRRRARIKRLLAGDGADA